MAKTKAVVATCVVFVDIAAVGANRIPAKFGLVENTRVPVPVSSFIAFTTSKEVMLPNLVPNNFPSVGNSIFEVDVIAIWKFSENDCVEAALFANHVPTFAGKTIPVTYTEVTIVFCFNIGKSNIFVSKTPDIEIHSTKF